MTKRKRSQSQPVLMGSACSGLCSELFAAQKLMWDVKAIFACDCDPHATSVCHHLWEHKHYWNDINDPDFMKNAPYVDIFLAGFPCQPFSVQGLGKGVDDKKNGGGIVYQLLRYIKKRRPKMLLLENVPGLLTKHADVLLQVMQILRGWKDANGLPLYTVLWAMLNSRDHGLPQNRQRIFIIGMLNSEKTSEFTWPTAVSCCPYHALTFFSFLAHVFL